MSDWQDIHAYIDNEVDSRERAELDHLLATCPKTRAEFESAKVIKQTLQTHCGGIQDEVVWKACVGRLDEMDKANRVTGFVSKYAWAIAGIFFACILTAGVMNRNNPSSTLRSGDMAQMVSGLVPVPKPVSNEAQALQKWFETQLGGSPEMASPPPVEVTSGATGVVQGRKVARLNLLDKDGALVLIVVENPPSTVEGVSPVAERSQMYGGKMENLNFVSWREGRFGLIVFGERPIDQLVPFASNVCLKE